MKSNVEITKEEFLKRMERSVEYAERQPIWMIGRPENRRQTKENESLGKSEVSSASAAKAKG